MQNSAEQNLVHEVMRNMGKTVIFSFTSLIILCVSMSQSLLSFASYTSTTTIVTSGIIKENAVESIRIRKHVIAYGMWRGFDEQTADLVSSHFDVLDIGWYSAEISGIERMKEENPDMVILIYNDVMGRSNESQGWNEVNSHEDWFVHDKYGNRLINQHWSWYCMDVGNDGWRNHYVNWVEDKFNKCPGLDGVFADDVWDKFRYDAWTVPSEDVPEEIGERWHNDQLEFLEYVKQRIGNKLLIINTSNNDDYVDACDGKMDEDFVHPHWCSYNYWASWTNWTGKIEGVRKVSQKGKYVLVHSGFKELNEDEAFINSHPEIVREMLMYCFSSYLFAIDGPKASFGFGGIHNLDGSRSYYSIFDEAKQLGSPINDYYSFYSVYARDFENGKVLVNPTTSFYTVHLDSEYKTLDGETVSSVTLDGHTGVVLVRM